MGIPKKVIIIGSSGCGKTTLFQFLTAEKVEDKPRTTKACEWALLRTRTEITVVDTPGLESDDDEWWEAIRDHQEVNLVIIMINGTHDRLQNLNKLNYVYKSIQGQKNHFKVLAIKGNNFEAEEFYYDFLEDHVPERFKYNDSFTSKSCLSRMSRDAIYEFIANAPSETITIFSPIKMIETLNEKIKLLSAAHQRNSDLDDSLKTSQKQVNHWASQYDVIEVKMKNADLIAQRKMGSLLDRFFELEDGKLEEKKDSWGWHFLSWLPFAGNVLLEKKRHADKETAQLVLEASGKSKEEVESERTALLPLNSTQSTTD